MPQTSKLLAPGAYKFTVKSADEAVALIRERLGPTARVLSVRSVEPRGFRKFFSGPRLEVVAQVDPAPNAASTLDAVSAEPATPEEPAIDRTVARESTPRTSRVFRGQDDVTTLGLSGLLRRSGITETALNRLQSGANWNELNTLPLHRALAETSRLLRAQVETRTARPPLSRAAFLGAPGVGRTTALCKWIAQEVFRRARIGHVVSVEFDRPNPLGPLPVFAEALGVPLAHFPCETRPAVPGGFVYFDLPGISPRRPADNAPLGEFLDREQIDERVLVLNAAYDRASLRDAYAAGRDLGATHLVFTHLDEVPQWGKLWDYLFDEALEPLFLATGPSLTGDCEEDVPGAIVRRTLPDEET
ncbi:MAG TPA: flagellar GTP-binding protein [Opitutaceae bacterium]|nr:flagellar GTP-binding protein [Opitutaceae bacterium]